MSESWTINSESTKADFLKHVEELYDKHKHITFSYKTGRQRTPKQNNSLHKYLSMLSVALNDAGWDMRKTLKPSIDIPWDKEGRQAKELIWRPIQLAVIGKESTTEAERSEYTKVYEVLNRHTSEKFGVSLLWPSE